RIVADRPFRAAKHDRTFWPRARGRPRTGTRFGPGSRVRRLAAILSPQIGTSDAIPAHQPAALGQAAGSSRPPGPAGDIDPAHRTGAFARTDRVTPSPARRPAGIKLRRGRAGDVPALVALEGEGLKRRRFSGALISLATVRP